MVAVRNSTHYGIAGYYSIMAAKAGMIGITGTNARPSIAPTFGVENMLGTNPLTIGFPTDEEFPFVLDCATSITQRGKLEYYSKMGKSTPEGMVIGRDGKPITDTDQILKDLTTGKAALAPLGGIGEEMGDTKATATPPLWKCFRRRCRRKLSENADGQKDGRMCLTVWAISLSP